MGMIDGISARRLTLDAIRQMRELDTGVTPGSQTYASDGMATLLQQRRKRRASQFATGDQYPVCRQGGSAIIQLDARSAMLAAEL